ncbi:MAG: methyltransferase domain-containing protein [Acidobacteriota bacterium]
MTSRMRLQAALLAGLLALPCLAQDRFAQSLGPYVPSPQPVVDRMLEAAAIKPGETVYDLGCGDARVLITAARKFKARGVGVELSAELVKRANAQIRDLGLQNRVTIIQGDLLEVDLHPADVVTVYLLTSSNERLKPKLESSLKPGARVVSHDFIMPGWRAARVEKIEAHGRTHTIYVYEMPPAKK